jgi:hypothetical protein
MLDGDHGIAGVLLLGPVVRSDHWAACDLDQ